MKEVKFDSYVDAEKFLDEVPRFTKKNPLEDTKGFYEYIQKVDNGIYAEKNLGKIIHVAGTNGKGSVCSFMQQICLKSGYKVAMFTSPHLITTRERFNINGESIGEKEFLEAYNWLADKIVDYQLINPEYTPTYFERLFFMGIYIFTKADIDITILETGLGGRLDTTNIIKNPVISIITEIGYDHTEYLGDTIEKIALEKAGIIKPEIPVVFADRKRETSEIFERISKQCGSLCYPVSKSDYKINENSKKFIDFSVYSRYYDYGRIIVNTMAIYQVENASIAIKASEVLCESGVLDKISKDSIKAGIEKMKWAGRMEEVYPGFFIDGAHNVDGIEAFVDTVNNAFESKNIQVFDSDKVFVVFSSVKDKRYDVMIKMLSGLTQVTDFVVTHIPGARGTELDILKNEFEKYTNKNIHAIEDIRDAIGYAMDNRGDNGIIYIVGSLYLAGLVKDII